jgi:branched-chain amino acid transport system ATP-binding protein
LDRKMPLLEIERLRAAYDGAIALDGVSLRVERGECVVILGANGAGKTTVLNCIAGLIPPQYGKVSLDGISLVGRQPHEIAALGLALVPEGRRIFPRHTVRENLELGGYQLLRKGRKREFEDGLREVFSVFPILSDRLHQPGGLLSGGEQQMLAIARALIGTPRVLLLDEPSLGLAPVAVANMWEVLTILRRRGLAILVAEQAAWAALRHSDRAIVLQRGATVVEDTADRLRSDPRIIEAYLGSKALDTNTVAPT